MRTETKIKSHQNDSFLNSGLITVFNFANNKKEIFEFAKHTKYLNKNTFHCLKLEDILSFQ